MRRTWTETSRQQQAGGEVEHVLSPLYLISSISHPSSSPSCAQSTLSNLLWCHCCAAAAGAAVTWAFSPLVWITVCHGQWITAWETTPHTEADIYFSYCLPFVPSKDKSSINTAKETAPGQVVSVSCCPLRPWAHTHGSIFQSTCVILGLQEAAAQLETSQSQTDQFVLRFLFLATLYSISAKSTPVFPVSPSSSQVDLTYTHFPHLKFQLRISENKQHARNLSLKGFIHYDVEISKPQYLLYLAQLLVKYCINCSLYLCFYLFLSINVVAM